MKRSKTLLASGAAVVSVAAWLVSAGVALYSGPPAQIPTADGTAQIPAAGAQATYAAGYVVHIDPETGKPTAASPGTVPLVVDAELRNALSTSSEGLVEVPSPVPGGGMMVDLQGRFQNTFVAAVGESGHIGASCLSSLPHDDESAVEPASPDEGDEKGGEGK